MRWTAETIYQCRKQRRWTQRETAEALGASTRAYQDWEAGKASPSRRFVEALNFVFGAPEASQSHPEPVPEHYLSLFAGLTDAELMACLSALSIEVTRRLAGRSEPASRPAPAAPTCAADVPNARYFTLRGSAGPGSEQSAEPPDHTHEPQRQAS